MLDLPQCCLVTTTSVYLFGGSCVTEDALVLKSNLFRGTVSSYGTAFTGCVKAECSPRQYSL